MNDELLKFLKSSGSRSTDKLAVLAVMVSSLPPEKMTKLKSVKVNWHVVRDGDQDATDLLPNMELEFYE